MGFQKSRARPISNRSCDDSTWHWWPSHEVIEERGYWKHGSLTHSVQSPAQRQAVRTAEPAGEASKWTGFAALFWQGRQGTPSSVRMVFVRSGGLNAVSTCAYSLPGMFKGEIGTHLRGWGQFFIYEAFPDNTLYSWRRTLCRSPGLSSNTEFTMLYYTCLFPFLSPLDCEPLKTGMVSYHCFNMKCLYILCVQYVC